MTAIVPDTLQGALIVSVIDFLLSFLIISGIGVILSLFPLLNRVALIFKTPPLTDAVLDKTLANEREVNAEAQENIAAITAAVFVAMDGAPHRIINIEPSPRRSAWVVEGRIAQHGSHVPNR